MPPWYKTLYTIILAGFAGVLDGLILICTIGFYCPYLADKIIIPYREKYIRVQRK